MTGRRLQPQVKGLSCFGRNQGFWLFVKTPLCIVLFDSPVFMPPLCCFSFYTLCYNVSHSQWLLVKIGSYCVSCNWKSSCHFQYTSDWRRLKCATALTSFEEKAIQKVYFSLCLLSSSLYGPLHPTHHVGSRQQGMSLGVWPQSWLKQGKELIVSWLWAWCFDNR